MFPYSKILLNIFLLAQVIRISELKCKYMCKTGTCGFIQISIDLSEFTYMGDQNSSQELKASVIEFKRLEIVNLRRPQSAHVIAYI